MEIVRNINSHDDNYDVVIHHTLSFKPHMGGGDLSLQPLDLQLKTEVPLRDTELSPYQATLPEVSPGFSLMG